MYQSINKFMIPKKNMVVVPENYMGAKNTLSADERNTMMCNLASLGFIPEANFYQWICSAERKTALETYTETMEILRDILGVKDYKPMYPNFPQQVIEASAMELLLNAIFHYYTNGDFMPIYEKLNRSRMISAYKPILLKVAEVEDFKKLGKNLMASKTSISEDDKAVLTAMFYGGFISNREIPSDIAHKENKAYVWALAIREFGLINIVNIEKAFTTATDVLRLMTALSDGDVSLASNTKFRSFKRAERRLFMKMLNNIEYDKLILDMDKYADRWKRVGERLHPFEFNNYEHVLKAFYAIRSNANIASFNGKVDELLKSSKTVEAAKLLSTRPGELARKLDTLLRRSDTSANSLIVERFRSVANDVDTPVLLQVRSHFMGRALEGLTADGIEGTRVFFPKGNTAKAYVTKNTLECISSNTCEQIENICTDALMFNYAKRDAMGSVYIHNKLKKYLVPFSQRSASKSLKTLVRGSHIDIDKKCKVVRAFIWWKDGEETTDLDLSAIMLDEKFDYVGQVSYTSLRTGEAEVVHSGDIVSAPNGACEFIDVDIDKMLQMTSGRPRKNVRYVAFNVYSYSNQKFIDLPECFMGWMGRNSMGHKGEIYDARTVENKIDLTGDTRVNVPMVLDLVNREIIWLDLALNNKAKWNNVESTKDNVCTLVKGIVNINKANIYDLITLNAKARGTVVKNKKAADIVFSLDEGITPFDVDEFMAKYI